MGFLFPAGPNKTIPAQTAEDLQLERLAAAMTFSGYYRPDVPGLNALWTDDAEILRKRQAVIRDLLDFPELVSASEFLLDCLDGWESRGRGRRADDFARGFSLEHFSWLDGYLNKMNRARDMFSAIPVRSEGFQKLNEVLKTVCESPEFTDAERDFQKLCNGGAFPERMTLGFNLDGELLPARFKLLNTEARSDNPGKRSEKREMPLTQRSVEMMNLLLQQSAGAVGTEFTTFVARGIGPLRGLRSDLIPALCAAKLCRDWEAAGMPFCFPEILPAEEKCLKARALWNPLLLLSEKEKVIPNDAEFLSGGELLFLTGANQGGKTVFLMSIGLGQWLAQLGFPVPAEQAEISPADNILTVFAPNSRGAARGGLLAEEAERIGRVMPMIAPGSLVLFNEPLTATAPEDTKAISAEVVSVCMAAGARGIWVTHVHELAAKRRLLEENLPGGSSLGSLRVIMDGSGAFTYHVERGEPEGDSHAEEALRRGGVWLEQETPLQKD